MKSTAALLLAVCWAFTWFLGCGPGDTSQSVTVSQNQSSSSSEPGDPCVMCSGTLAEITDCLDGFGMMPDDRAD